MRPVHNFAVLSQHKLNPSILYDIDVILNNFLKEAVSYSNWKPPQKCSMKYGAPKNFPKFIGQPMLESLFNKIAGLKAWSTGYLVPEYLKYDSPDKPISKGKNWPENISNKRNTFCNVWNGAIQVVVIPMGWTSLNSTEFFWVYQFSILPKMNE